VQEIVDSLRTDHLMVVKPSTVHKRLTGELGYRFMSLIPPSIPTPTVDFEPIIELRYEFWKRLSGCRLEDICICDMQVFNIGGKNEKIWIPKEFAEDRQKAPPSYLSPLPSPVGATVLTTFNTKGVVRYDIFQGYLNSSILLHHLRKGFNSQERKSRNVLLISHQICRTIHKEKDEESFDTASISAAS
jgi:hypothetical protein